MSFGRKKSRLRSIIRSQEVPQPAFNKKTNGQLSKLLHLLKQTSCIAIFPLALANY